MGQRLHIHPDNPQQRLLQIAVDALRLGQLVVYPTDTTYALAWHLGDKNALDRVVNLRGLSKNHQFTLACRDLSELGSYAKVDNSAFRLLKRYTPGPFVFILPATREVPKRLLHPKRRTIGIRVPDNNIARDLLNLLDEPVLTTTLVPRDDQHPFADAQDIYDQMGNQVDVILDGGACGLEESTVVDLTGAQPEITRQGKGEIEL